MIDRGTIEQSHRRRPQEGPDRRTILPQPLPFPGPRPMIAE